MGNAGNRLVDDLVAKAANRGITVKPGETVNLKVNMGGTITSPTITTDLKAAATSMQLVKGIALARLNEKDEAEQI